MEQTLITYLNLMKLAIIYFININFIFVSALYEWPQILYVASLEEYLVIISQGDRLKYV